MILRMATNPHPYYAGLLRWIDAHREEWTISSFAKAIGLDNSTIRKALTAGSGPSAKTVDAVKAQTGLGFEEIVNWCADAGSSDDEMEAEFRRRFAALGDRDRKRRALAVLDLLAQEARTGEEDQSKQGPATSLRGKDG